MFLPLTQSHLLNEFSSDLILLNIVGKIGTILQFFLSHVSEWSRLHIPMDFFTYKHFKPPI